MGRSTGMTWAWIWGRCPWGAAKWKSMRATHNQRERCRASLTLGLHWAKTKRRELEKFRHVDGSHSTCLLPLFSARDSAPVIPAPYFIHTALQINIAHVCTCFKMPVRDGGAGTILYSGFRFDPE